ncbi:ABC transporter ATP-binding protein [Mycetocola reblochoni]|uniref:Methionine ABC transporter ATP-binding protein n=2 Tax=Mycetocola reblochoni TaxID=331618 RepID=A0A1R4K782_9MICO|nr:ABC transporter ATP-binding protein [Mycetocola reblochoni]RLP71110.1 ABC transporter ATP-binding protein [Mycetocola reblochoni]SJN40149.1 Methionine ABC transporter ATP-binding protein [Mycetocola reblochoni REB411]
MTSTGPVLAEPAAPGGPADRARADTTEPRTVDAAGLRGRRVPLVTGTALGVVGAVVTLAQPLLAGRLIADVSAGTFGLLSVAPLMALFAIDAILSISSQLLLARASEGYVYGLRSYLISRVLRGYWPAVHGYDRGDLYSRLVVDTALSKGWIVGAIPALLSSLTMVIGCGIAMAILSLPLFLLTFAVLALFGGAAWWTARGVQRAATENQEDTAGFIEGVQRMISSLVTIKASGLEAQVDADTTGRADRARRSGVRVLTRTAVLTPVMNVGTQAAIAVAVIAGAAFVASGSLTTAAMVSFFMYLLYIVAPLVQASSALGDIAQCRAALARVREVGGVEQERVRTDGDARLATTGHARIELGGVEIRHDESPEPLLTGIDGRFSSPGLVALVGPNGVGKSTLLWLACGLQRPTGGRVSVDGVDVAEWPVAELRRRVVLVQQDAAPMTGTIRDNLQFGSGDHSDGERLRLLERVGLGPLLARLPDGLDTGLGEGGVELSGGQRRLLAVARALLADPGVLLLDEFTSNVDQKGAEKLLRIARDLASDRLVIVTSHASAILNIADRIVELTPTGLENRPAVSAVDETAGTG